MDFYHIRCPPCMQGVIPSYHFPSLPPLLYYLYCRRPLCVDGPSDTFADVHSCSPGSPIDLPFAPCIDACSYQESTSEHGVAWFWFTIGSCSIMVGWGVRAGWGEKGSDRRELA